jgi:AcrR family transcriptional regulator
MAEPKSNRMPPKAPHRPSRRTLIVDAAITTFARQGFNDANIQTIAQEAGVAPTAVYYHFAGKSDLFEAALRRVVESINEVVRGVRADDEPGDAKALAAVISAVWTWLEDNPDSCLLLYHHLPGMTSRAAAVQQEFEELHVQRAFDYLPTGPTPKSRRSAISRRAAETLAVRTLIALTILVHPMRGQDGPLSSRSDRAVRDAVIDVSLRLLGSPNGDLGSPQT